MEFLWSALNSVYKTEDCHGHSGLAITDCGLFTKPYFEKTKPMLKQAK